MPARLNPPVEKSFAMEITDALYGNDGAHTMITIRQATQRDFERINELNSEYKRIYGAETDATGQVVVQQKFNLSKLQRLQAFCTIVRCELEDADGHPLFNEKTRSSEKAFEEAWGMLPAEVCDEIHGFIVQVNPSWDDRGEAS